MKTNGPWPKFDFKIPSDISSQKCTKLIKTERKLHLMR